MRAVPLRRLLDACAVLLLKLLVADVVCARVGEWIAYFFNRPGGAARRRRSTGNASRGLQVIICGFPRTGTLSLKNAMEILGFPCLHGFDLVLNPRQCNLLMKAASSGKASDWDRVLQGYAAIADFPGACAYKRLMELYPDAKLVLSVREAERWYRSMSQTVVARLQARDMVAMIRRRSAAQRATRTLFLRRLVLDCQAEEGNLNNKEAGINNHIDSMSEEDCKRVFITAYRHHTHEVMAHVPPTKLLVFDVEKNLGWAPLCEFLGVPVPPNEVPFPRSNDPRSLNQFFSFFVPIYTTLLALYVAFLSFLVTFIFHQYHNC